MFWRKGSNPNQEIEEYRSLMEVPDRFEDGFTIRSIVGVLFVAFIMIPGNMYLSLMVGGSLGAAAEWVTIILFAEITKRSFTTLSRQEVYVLFYVASGLIAAETGAFEGLLWNQYLRQSPAATQFGIANLFPDWWAPPLGSPALLNRTFLHADWFVPILVLVASMVISRMSWFSAAYTLFRVNSDYERLPFPFAPVAAQGATALAESTQGVESWRWRVFSAGAMIGLVFGALYVAIPAITGAILTEPVQLLPIPFVDFTQISGNFIPATPLGFTVHLGPIFSGMVMPFWGVMGGFFGILAATVANPILHEMGILSTWQPGMGAIDTFFMNSVDFWMSFGIGSTFAIALIGIYQLIKGVRVAQAEKRVAGEEGRSRMTPPPGRGDFPIWTAIGLYMVAMGGLILMAWLLMPGISRFIYFFLFFAFIFTPFQSFVSARLVGMVGQTVSIPFVREATILLSGYPGVDIWFVPFPVDNYGAQTQKFREIELTGTSFTSIIKAEVMMVPIVLLSTFLYSSYLWKLAPIPSASYPYAQQMWRLRAMQTCIWFTGTLWSTTETTDTGAVYTPANLVGDSWWYWKVRAVSQQWIDSDGERGEAGPWTEKRAFYAFTREGDPGILPEQPPGALSNRTVEDEERSGPAVVAVAPAADVGIVRTARPQLRADAVTPLPAGWHYYFAVDTDPNFTSPWIQRSTDESWLMRALNPTAVAAGGGVVVLLYIVLSMLGFPLLFVFGMVRALTTIPHFMITEFIGALLARYYFWKKYGKQEWRQYAPILAVGFACGMALMGMAAVAVAIIQKSVSVLVF